MNPVGVALAPSFSIKITMIAVIIKLDRHDPFNPLQRYEGLGKSRTIRLLQTLGSRTTSYMGKGKPALLSLHSYSSPRSKICWFRRSNATATAQTGFLSRIRPLDLRSRSCASLLHHEECNGTNDSNNAESYHGTNNTGNSIRHAPVPP